MMINIERFGNDESLTEVFVQHINSIIETAITHGGDNGGAYFIEKELLFKKMERFRKWLGMDDYLVCDDGGYLFYAKPVKVGEE